MLEAGAEQFTGMGGDPGPSAATAHRRGGPKRKERPEGRSHHIR
jgi:hypothetical protein